VERAFAALNSTAGTAQHQMIQQFCRRAALRMHNAFATHFCEITKQQDKALAQTALNAKVNGTNDARRAANLTLVLATVRGHNHDHNKSPTDQCRHPSGNWRSQPDGWRVDGWRVVVQQSLEACQALLEMQSKKASRHEDKDVSHACHAHQSGRNCQVPSHFL